MLTDRRLLSVLIQSEMFWREHWPFTRGKGIAQRFNNWLCEKRIIGPTWVNADGLWFFADPREHLCKYLIKDRKYEPEVLKTLLSYLPEGGTFVDVGAHIGYVAVNAARQAGSSGTVVAIEANPEMVRQLKQNVERNELSNIVVMNRACFDRDSTLRLYISSFMNRGKTSLSALNAGSEDFVEVVAERLDDILRRLTIQRCDVVKIDVEGAELGVLRGMTGLLNEARPVIVLELISDLLANFKSSPEEVKSFLQSYSYAANQIGTNDWVFLPRA